MLFRLALDKKFKKQLRKLDSFQANIILRWLEENIDGCENPRINGKLLAGKLAGLWRYRIGNYRVICKIQDDKLIVLAIEVGHRREIYK